MQKSDQWIFFIFLLLLFLFLKRLFCLPTFMFDGCQFFTPSLFTQFFSVALCCRGFITEDLQRICLILVRGHAYPAHSFPRKDPCPLCVCEHRHVVKFLSSRASCGCPEWKHHLVFSYPDRPCTFDIHAVRKHYTHTSLFHALLCGVIGQVHTRHAGNHQIHTNLFWL